MKKISYCLLAMVLLSTVVSAQVTIGSGKVPESFSALEVVSNNIHGLRLPQIETTARRDEIFTNAPGFQANGLAQGLQIFNMETRCVETWNGTVWIQSCSEDGPYVPPLPPADPITSIPSGTGTTDWATNAWVGAFWRNNQTGERIIRSTNNTPWTVTVDPDYTDWVVVDNARENATLWKDGVAPDDAELYQVSGSHTLSGTGDILFRFGLKSTNPNPVTSDFKAMNPETGAIVNSRAPRYATATLNINGTNYKLFLRQGEAADYVFSPEDPATGATTTRPLAVKFSPYNLTDENLSETLLSNPTAINGGKFVEFPTQAGAFWQWAAPAGYERIAYHPSNPAGSWTGAWTSSYANGNWDGLNGRTTHETCPDGWRRPTVGATNDTHGLQAASGSELMQSLFYTTFNGGNFNTNSSNHRYFGYYADGFFDRLPIVVNASGVANNSSVGFSTKDTAYRGLLFTNPVTNASLFTPAGGLRKDGGGALSNAGSYGEFWSSSACTSNSGWLLEVGSSRVYQYDIPRSSSLTVRCVSDN